MKKGQMVIDAVKKAIDEEIKFNGPRPKHLIYEDVKKRLRWFPLTSDQYEEAIKYTTNVLKI